MHKVKITLLAVITSGLIYAQDVAFLNTVGGTGFDSASKIATDDSNNIYVLGSFSETVDFDPGPDVFNLTSTAFDDIYLQKLDAQGNFIWAVAFGSAEYESPTDLEVHENGNIYIIGTHRGPIDLDPGPGEFLVTPQGENDFYIIALNSDGSFNNAKTWGGTGHDHAIGMSMKNTGELLITGVFNETVDFDPDAPVVNKNAADGNAYVLTLSPGLEFVDVFTFGIPDAVYAYDLMVDTDQNLIVTGTFGGTIDFDPSVGITTLISTGDHNIFVAKYSSSQELIWVKAIGNSDIFNLLLRSSTIDNNNNILITGAFNETLDLDPNAGVFEITSNGGKDLFVVKFDPDGEFIWGHGIGGTEFAPDEGYSIKTNSLNEVIMSGKFAGTVDFNPGPDTYNLSSNGYKDIFLLHLDATGDFKNAYSMGGPELDVGVGVTVDSNNAVIIGGTFRETADMHPGPGVFNRTSNGDADAFVMKLNSLILGTGNFTDNTLQLSAYPNPTDGEFTLLFGNEVENVDVSITNTIGQLLYSKKFQQEKSIILSLPNSPGVYFCNVTIEGHSKTLKVIKK